MKKREKAANDIRQRILDEACKRPEDMDMTLILEGLDRIDPFDPEADAERARDAFADFTNRYDLASTDRRAHQRRRPIRLAAAALLVLGMVVGVCSALSFTTWNTTALWDDETLNVLLDSTDDSAAPYLRSTPSRVSADVWGDEVYEMMEEHNLFVTLPSWKPEGFEFQSADHHLQSNGTTLIAAVYQNKDGKYINLAVRELLARGVPDSKVVIEADENIQETVMENGNTYYISSNLENITLTWIDNGKNIQISGDIDRSEIGNIISSMGATTNEED